MNDHFSFLYLPLAATIDLRSSEGSGWIGSWAPGIGDPNFMGWFTVFAYLLCAILCWHVRKLTKIVDLVDGDRELRFWTLMVLFISFLCVNKQLDLQTAMTEFFRLVFKHEGLYQSRRKFQLAFIGALALCLPLSIWIAYRFGGHFPRSVKLTGMGVVILAVFILVRASSFHNVDIFLGADVAKFQVNWILELGGIAVISWGANRRRCELRRIHRAQTPA